MFTIKIHPKLFFLFLFTITFSLQGCGSERDTPFNPTNNSSNSGDPTLGASVEINLLVSGDDPLLPFADDGRSIIVLRNETEFEQYLDAYTTAPITGSYPDFTQGQVLLIDEGLQDTCTQKLSFRSIRANKYSTNSVKVTIDYRDQDSPNSSSSNSASSVSSASSSSAGPLNCTDVAGEVRSFRFYFIESRARIMVDDKAVY